MRYFFRALKLMRPYVWLLAVFVVCTMFGSFFNAAPLALGKAYFEHLQNHSSSELDVLKKSEAMLKKPGTTDTFRWMEDTFHRAEKTLVGWIGDDPNTYLYGICALIIVCVIFRGLFDFLTSYISAWIAQRMQVDAVERLMNHLLVLDIGFHDRRKMGDLVSRMLGDTNCLRMTAKLALEFISKPPEILILVFLAIMWSWKLFLIGAIGLPLVIGPLMTFTRRIYKHAMRARVQAADMSQDMLQDLTGMRTVHAYEAAKAEGENFNMLAEKYFRSSMRMARNRALLKPCSEILMMIGGIAVLAVGSTWVLQGEMSLAIFLSFFGALAMCYNPIRGMLSSFSELAEFVPSAERAFELLDTKSKIVDAPNATVCPTLQKEILFEKVTLDYGRGPVFSNLDLRIKVGERIGVVGRTGIGKSTLLSLLLRFYDPTEGRILIDGEDIRNVKLASLRSQMALVTQDPFLFHTTIEENIRYGRPGATLDEIVSAAKAAAVHDEILEQPDGYQTVVGERGVTLSGGQRQRISVARAILRNAPILLLDEATSALDSSVEKQVQDALDLLSRDRTTLVVAHRLSTIRTADRIVVFSDDGGIETVGPHDRLMETSATYRHLWERQSGQTTTPLVVAQDARRDGELPRRAAD